MGGLIRSATALPAIVLGPLLGLMAPVTAWPDPPPAPTPGPSPTPLPSPTPPPAAAPPPRPSPRPRLRLDLDRHVDQALSRDPGDPGSLRFEDSVDVEARAPQSMLERHLDGLHLECGPAGGGGAPTEVESRAVRPHPSVSVDFLPLLRSLWGALGRKKGAERFFLYRMENQGRVTFVVRTERVPDSYALAVPGLTYSLVETYPDLGSAAAALRRLEQGFARPERSDPGAPPPPWATATPCRPR